MTAPSHPLPSVPAEGLRCPECNHRNVEMSEEGGLVTCHCRDCGNTNTWERRRLSAVLPSWKAWAS